MAPVMSLIVYFPRKVSPAPHLTSVTNVDWASWGPTMQRISMRLECAVNKVDN